MSSAAERLAAVESRIAAACRRAARPRSDVLLVAVGKQRPLESLRELHALGTTHFAENRVQELRERIPVMPAGLTWHFVGHLQTNKAKYLPGLIHWIHSVDNLAAAEALDKAWAKHPDLPPAKILLQFNIAEEEQKHGASQTAALEFLRAALELPRIDIQGLMTMAPHFDNPASTRPTFRRLRELRDDLQSATNHPLPHLSMGMTNDFEIAIEEGATMVRVGTALFEGP